MSLCFIISYFGREIAVILQGHQWLSMGEGQVCCVTAGAITEIIHRVAAMPQFT